MKDHKFSAKSQTRLNTVNIILSTMASKALRISEVDFGIPAHGGRRTADEQLALYRLEKSLADGWKERSVHQDGFGLDVFAYVDGAASWDGEHLRKVTNAFRQAYAESPAEIKNNYSLDFGIDWQPLVDGVGWDAGHISLVRKVQTS